MTVFDVQRFSVHDGPGIRTTVFLKGCPLRCAWCHNPEGLTFGADLANPKVRELSPAALAEELLADRVFFETSGGGVTFSGGEPLAQAEELIATARLLRQVGISVAVETSLEVPWSVIEAVADAVDLVLADLKVADAADHERWTGRGNGLILANFARLAERVTRLGHPALKARTPLIPGHTETEANLGALAAFLDQWPGRWDWEHLPFNALAASKYRALGLAYPFSENP